MKTSGLFRGAGVGADGSARSVFAGLRVSLYAVAATGCVLASRFASGVEPSSGRGLVVGIALAAIAIAMWHGAYDAVQAEPLLKPRLQARWYGAFFAGYAALVAMVLVGWWAFPFVSLVLFLGYSAWHFGTEPERGKVSAGTRMGAVALGALPIVAACRWHGVAVQAIFAQMLGGAQAAPAHAGELTSAMAHCFWPVLAVACVAAALGQMGWALASRAETLAVVGITAGLFAWCDPLVAFAVYFCCWHTPEHLIATSLPDGSSATPWQRIGGNLRAGLVPWLLTLVLVGVMFALGRHAAEFYRAEIFIVLSALTVPHMALNELDRWQRIRKAESEDGTHAGRRLWQGSEA